MPSASLVIRIVTFDRTAWTGDRPAARNVSTRTAQHRRIRANIYTTIGIQVRDLSIRAIQESRHRDSATNAMTVKYYYKESKSELV
jgi:hypothetical protein